MAACLDGFAYIILSEQMEGTEHLVVLEIERPSSLEIALKGRHGRHLYSELLWRANLAELLLMLRGRDPRRPSRPAAVVSVRMGGGEVGGMTTVAEILRHCDLIFSAFLLRILKALQTG